MTKDPSDLQGRLLWEPTPETIADANVTRFVRWLREKRGHEFTTYDDLWQWSVTDLDGFWGAVWDFFDVQSRTPYEAVLTKKEMPGSVWFPGVELNYAEHALSRRDEHVAITSESEVRSRANMTYAELHREVASFAAGLRAMGVEKGDRVISLMPNIPETVVAFLATASIGAIWSACSPEFGISSVIERFRQIEPKVLIAIDGYRYRGEDYDKRDAVRELQGNLPTLERTVVLPYLSEEPDLSELSRHMLWDDVLVDTDDIEFEAVPFDHPLWVLYTSGTTGLPKPIVHGHGGVLLEHLKTLALHMDLGENDRFFWYTTTGWMMWNFLIGGLLIDATVQLFDGDPSYPDLNRLWSFAQDTGTTYFGTSAPFIHGCMKVGLRPNKSFDLAAIRGIGSTGAPLSPEGFVWAYENVNDSMLLGSFSGGTDVCTGFVGPSPLLPVHAGEIQCRCLGAKVEAFDENGNSVTNEVGELVLTEPLVSMPLFFWNDEDGKRLRESYFEMYDGVWRHGDWVEITDRGTLVISGRSDSTLKRSGIRMGTSDFYRVIEDMDEVADSLVVDTSSRGDAGSSSALRRYAGRDCSRRRFEKGDGAEVQRGAVSPVGAGRDSRDRRCAPHIERQEGRGACEENPLGLECGPGRQPRRHGQSREPAVLRRDGGVTFAGVRDPCIDSPAFLHCFDNSQRTSATPSFPRRRESILRHQPCNDTETSDIFIPGGEGGNPHEIFRAQRGI